MTNDGDFRDAHLLSGKPRRPWLVRTGDISNASLRDLIQRNIDAIVRALDEVQFVELSAGSLIVHDDRR